MIPILYKQSEKAFKSNGIGRLADATSCIAHERRNEAFDLEMTYPSAGRYAKELKVGRIILATHDNSRKPQAFDIVSVRAESNGQIRVTGEHISRRLKGILTKLNRMWWTELDTVQLFFKDLNDKTSTGYIIGACDFTFHTDVSNAKRGYSPKSSSFISVFDHLTDAQYGLLSVENGVGVDADYRWDMYDVSLLKQRGTYRGVKMRTGKNVKTLTVEENNKHLVSGVLAFWHGNDPITGKDRTVTITGDMASVEDKTDFGKPEDILLSGEQLPYQRVEVLDISSKFSYPPKPEQVRAEAQFYLDQQNEFYAKGSSSYAVDLAYDTTGTAEMQTADLCDWVMVEDVGMRVQKKLQVTEVWYDTLRDRYTSMTVGLLPRTFKQLVHKESAPVNQKSDNLTSQVKDLAEKTDVENKVYPTGYDPKHPESWTNPGGELTDAEGNKVEQVATINRRPVFVKTVGGSGGSSAPANSVLVQLVENFIVGDDKTGTTSVIQMWFKHKDGTSGRNVLTDLYISEVGFDDGWIVVPKTEIEPSAGIGYLKFSAAGHILLQSRVTGVKPAFDMLQFRGINIKVNGTVKGLIKNSKGDITRIVLSHLSINGEGFDNVYDDIEDIDSLLIAEMSKEITSLEFGQEIAFNVKPL